MIVFMRDWKKYPTALPDFGTKNKSFIHLSSTYKAMGVKNHAFTLALIDQRLKGVDPHDPELTLVEKARVSRESKINPWYWLREVARVPGISGEGDGPVLANRGIISAWWLYFNHITCTLVCPRQTGKSFSVDLLAVYLCEVAKRDSDISMLTRSEKLRVKTIARIKEADKALPSYMSHQGRYDSKNTFSYTVNALGNTYTAYLPSKSEKTADALGKGFTTDTVFIDEGPFQDNSHITIPALLPASIAAREAAERAKSHYGIIFTTTAGSRKTKEGKFMYKLQNDAAHWTEVFLDCKNLKDLEESIRRNARGTTLTGEGVLRVNASFDHRQLGKTDEWLIKTAEITGSTGDNLKMDYFNMWVSGGTEHPLTRKLQDILSKGHAPILYTEKDKIDNYILNWYIQEKDIDRVMKEETIISVDSSDALGNDDIAVTITHVRTGKVICAGTFNYTSLNAWGKWLFRLLMRFENSLLMMERKSSGMALLDIVVDMLIEVGENPFRRIFNMVVNNKRSSPKLYEDMETAIRMGRISEFYGRTKKQFGFATSGGGMTSRKDLYSAVLVEASTNVGHVISDRSLQDQILSLRNKNGRVDHIAGGHDDLVIAWLLSYWLMSRAANLEYYGIDANVILKDIHKDNEKEVTPEELALETYQDSIKSTINNLKKTFMNTNDNSIKYAAQRKIISLADRLEIGTESDSFHPDQLLKELRDSQRVDTKTIRKGQGSNYKPWQVLS